MDSCGLSHLLFCVYLPACGSSTASSEYLNTLGELQGFIASQHFDVLLIAGDCNVDFDRSGPFHSLLVDFITELNLFVCDLPFKNPVWFTYEGSQGFPPSWIDHVLCSASYYSRVTDVFTLRSRQICLTIFLYASLLLWNALMHGLPLPLLDLLITYFIGLRLLKLTLRDSVLWLLITLLLFLFMSVTVSYFPVQVILPFWIPMLRI